MFLLVTILGTVLGIVAADRVNQRFGPHDPRRWWLLLPVWLTYGVVLLTAGTREAWPQAVGPFAFASLFMTAVDLLGALRRRRHAEP